MRDDLKISELSFEYPANEIIKMCAHAVSAVISTVDIVPDVWNAIVIENVIISGRCRINNCVIASRCEEKEIRL